MSVVLSEHLPLLASAPDGIQKLRGLILELAVRGKLVPQDPNDDPASELLKRIAQERARLETEGACKKSKVAPSVSENERPFHLPDSWRWGRLGHFCLLEMGQSPSSEHYNQSGDGIPFFQGKADFGAKYPTARYWCTEPTKYADNGDVLLSVRAPVGPTNVAQFRCCIGRGLAALRPLGGVPTGYLLLVVQARRSALESLATGTTFVAVSKGDIEPFLVPIPPLAEQHRIVAKVEELMALCDRLEAEQVDSASAHALLVETLLGTLTQSIDAADLVANWQRLAEHFDTLFTTEASIDALKQTVLQLAVMGKLVPQDSEEVPAGELLREIATKRAAALELGYPNPGEAAGQQRKQEKQSCPDGLQILPKGWSWATLMQCSELVVDCHNKTAPYVDRGIPLLRTTNIRDGELNLRDPKFVSPETYERWSARCKPRPGDLLITREAPMGEVCIIPDGMTVCMGQRMMLIRLVKDTIAPRFLLYSLLDPKLMERVQDKPVGATVEHLRVGGVETLLIPVAPLAEQHRIVAKVDELMALCDRLKADLVTARQKQATLADTLIDSALEAA